MKSSDGVAPHHRPRSCVELARGVQRRVDVPVIAEQSPARREAALCELRAVKRKVYALLTPTQRRLADRPARTLPSGGGNDADAARVSLIGDGGTTAARAPPRDNGNAAVACASPRVDGDSATARAPSGDGDTAAARGPPTPRGDGGATVVRATPSWPGRRPNHHPMEESICVSFLFASRSRLGLVSSTRFGRLRVQTYTRGPWLSRTLSIVFVRRDLYHSQIKRSSKSILMLDTGTQSRAFVFLVRFRRTLSRGQARTEMPH